MMEPITLVRRNSIHMLKDAPKSTLNPIDERGTDERGHLCHKYAKRMNKLREKNEPSQGLGPFPCLITSLFPWKQR